MQNNPQHKHITVGIIAKNEAKNIENTLKYLMEQSYPHEFFEIIIADGNSSDGTREVAERSLGKGDIAHKIINEKDQPNNNGGCNYGHSFARNIIIDNTDPQSEYIAWIDADCRADTEWLASLVKVMENSTDSQIIGAGGRRIVEEGAHISKKELMLNYYFTSQIISLGNPAFTESDTIYMSSIAGYNSIYQADTLRKYRYNTTYAFNTDDIEINLRLAQDGYIFLNSRKSKIYHRMNSSIILFLKQMGSYGKGAIQTSLLHNKISRLYIPISLIYILGILLTPIFCIVGGVFWGITIGAWGALGVLTLAVFIENVSQTKSLQSLWIFILVPLHPLMYGYGVIKGLSSNNKL